MTAVISEGALTPHLQLLGTSPEASNPLGLKCVAFETKDTVDDGDRVDIDLSNYGLTKLWDVWMFTHSTKDDVVITESTEFVSSVTGTTVSLIVQGSTDDKKRVILLWGQ